ncbi:CAP domain-containing protein [Shewanella intestini]|uniref:SCP domain-containing protein n=1 Tax=Shewanella intestini TaxID=2017544 RepID=A0ABS5HXR9_9GAMM|nr:MULTISPECIES: CAP domain-containing protein [Shewanella]MBR9726557.1 hypothetical protein [Shewanella intestini]MRG34877.1 hypothetical protein [Shewanella sp. XMDDZSB0408]
MMKNANVLKLLSVKAPSLKLAAVTLALGSTVLLSGCGSTDSDIDKAIESVKVDHKDLAKQLAPLEKPAEVKQITGKYGKGINGQQLPPKTDKTITGHYGKSISGQKLPPVKSVTGKYGKSISGQQLPPAVTQSPSTTIADLTYADRLMHVLKTFKSVANGKTINSGGQNNMPLTPDSLAPTSGNDFNGIVNFDQSSIVFLNGAGLVDNWHCYKTATNGVTLTRNSAGLTADGTITEYKYLFPQNQCSTQVIASFSFHNMAINDQLGIAQGDVTVSAPNTADTTFDSSELLVANKLADLGKHFGAAWAKMQADTIQKAAKANPSLLTLNKQTQQAEFNFAGVQSELIEYKSLDQSSLLAGTVFGGVPGASTPASVKWCNIVNIPTDGSTATIQAQSVIAMNCARSVARYCDGHDGFQAGVFAPVAPLAWNNEVATAAMDNVLLQKAKGQGHWETHNMAQNAFVIGTTSAITPIFGYTSPRTDGKVNNAGQNSWAGHPGHCQNVMGKNYNEFGVAWLLDTENKLDYWTENLR